MTKVGYVQGANLELARQREEEGRPFPEMVKYEKGSGTACTRSSCATSSRARASGWAWPPSTCASCTTRSTS